MAMAKPENADRLVEVLKEIRDELRAVRVDLGARGDGRMTSDGIRTQVIDRSASWRAAALAAGAVAGLALVIGVVMRDRRAPATATTVATPVAAMPALPAPAVMPAPAPVVFAAPVAVHEAAPATTPPRSPVLTPASRPAAHEPAEAPAIASLPVLPKQRVKPNLGAKPAAEVASDDDATMAFPRPPRRARVHRLSYGPVGSEPAKL
jgi:hypothetical protein